MQLSRLLRVIPMVLTAIIGASASAQRQGQGQGYTILAPANGSTIAAEATFNFSFAIPTYAHCRPPSTLFSVWLVQGQPDAADLNAAGRFDDYLMYYGDYIDPDYPAQKGILPPPTYEMPNLEISTGLISIAVITDNSVCKNRAPEEYALASNTIMYVAPPESEEN